MNHLLETKNLAIGYKNKRNTKTISDNLNLSLRAGELVCLIGPNGAGKSTLIRTLIGMQPPLEGNVILTGENLKNINAPEKAKKLSVVLTTPVLVSHFRAFDIVSLGRYPYTNWSGRLSEEDKQIVMNSISSVGADKLAYRLMGQLSDGEKQKIMIARGLAQDPNILVLDEPTAFLDLPHKVEIMRILKSLTNHPNRTVLLSIHDLELAMRTADKIWLLDKNGNLHFGAPEDMVLTGVLNESFEMKGVHFDIQKGTFIIESEKRGNVVVVGDYSTENELIWTERALERIGYTTFMDKPACMKITVSNFEDTICWQWKNCTECREFYSIGSLVDFIQTLPDNQELFKTHLYIGIRDERLQNILANNSMSRDVVSYY